MAIGPKSTRTGVGSSVGISRAKSDDIVYHYGYPAYGPSQSDVIIQTIMVDAGSGDVTNQVTPSEVFVISESVPGEVPTFGHILRGAYSGLSPGVKYVGNGDRHLLTDPAAGHVINASDFTYEIWFKPHDECTTNDQVLCEFRKHGTTTNSYINLRVGLNLIQVRINTSAGTIDANYAVTASKYTDGKPHKIRVSADRDGMMTLYLDGVSYGSVDISEVNGSNLDYNRVALGNDYEDNFASDCFIYEFRVSKNKTNNSGGPAGG